MKIKKLSDIISNSFVTLDCLQANVFIANQDMVLIYMNPKAKKTLANIDKEIFEAFNIRVDEFVGGSIHRFHGDSQRVMEILQNPSALPNHTMINNGKIHWEILLNSITAADGEIVGYIINWLDKTEQAKVADEMEKLVEELKMIENDFNNC